MNEYIPIILVVCVVALTVVLVIAGINLIGILMQLKKTLKKANETVEKVSTVVDTTQDKIEGILNPFHSLSAFVTNFTAGLKVAEGFMGWINKDKVEEELVTEEDEKGDDRKSKKRK